MESKTPFNPAAISAGTGTESGLESQPLLSKSSAVRYYSKSASSGSVSVTGSSFSRSEPCNSLHSAYLLNKPHCVVSGVPQAKKSSQAYYLRKAEDNRGIEKPNPESNKAFNHSVNSTRPVLTRQAALPFGNHTLERARIRQLKNSPNSEVLGVRKDKRVLEKRRSNPGKPCTLPTTPKCSNITASAYAPKCANTSGNKDDMNETISEGNCEQVLPASSRSYALPIATPKKTTAELLIERRMQVLENVRLYESNEAAQKVLTEESLLTTGKKRKNKKGLWRRCFNCC